MTLNEKIGVILKQHKEGEEFFNALDFMIKGDRSILEDFLSFFMNDAGKKLNLGDTGLIVSGGFGNAIMTMYGDRDDSYYLERTRAGISVALRKIRPDASIFETYVIYDGSMGRADKVKSMYRYNSMTEKQRRWQERSRILWRLKGMYIVTASSNNILTATETEKISQAMTLIRDVVGNSTQSSRELGFNAVERCRICMAYARSVMN